MSTYSITRLDLTWSTSKGRDTYGYNIARLDDSKTKERFKCMGGGYDMTGTCFGDWLASNYQERLLAIKDQAHRVWNGSEQIVPPSPNLYGMSYDVKANKVTCDGGCGINSMIKIAEAIGLEVQSTSNKKGHCTGFIVSEEVASDFYTKQAQE